MSTFDTQCYPSYQPTEEVPDFFSRTVSLYQTLPSYDWLAAAGVVPSTTVPYTAQQFQDALSPHHGGNQVYLGCTDGNQIDELWYYYYVQGSVQDGTFEPTEFGSSSCPATGIHYYPKGYVPPYTAAGTPATITSSSTTGQGPFTLTTSKGLCAIQADSSLFCDASVTTGAQFYSDGSSLQFNGSDVFSAATTPSGTAQGVIFAGDGQPVDIGTQWVPKC
ncbi:Ribonuclease T2 precursor (RNase T2) [Friedmanniomyces endolithicus]|uniref:Ribonuclease T2 (RNase T2) n=1 Tax=Rachicladosporium monterosium TaxID=1507873 RepID=A0ABR0LHD2_9PEZI|nr:Ribonuclease T2 precursor (RNase T2) [Friedmanniomyces endolithicus]KAK5147940.1 Ribonuclease T2 precursor (RNase T2) [Rachicladosporium monterosium]